MDLQRYIQQLSKPTAAIFLLSPKCPENFIWVHLLLFHLTCSEMCLAPFALAENAIQVAYDFCSEVRLHMPASHCSSLRCHWLMSCCGAMPFCLRDCLCLLSLLFWRISRSVLQFCRTSYMQNRSLFCLQFIPEYSQVQTTSAGGSRETTCSSASLKRN